MMSQKDADNLICEVRDPEKTRREALTVEERKGLSSLADFLAEVLVPKFPEGYDRDIVVRRVGALTTGKNPKSDPDSITIAPSYQAWPVDRVVPDWVEAKFQQMTWYWDALSTLVQHEIRLVGDQYESIKEARKLGALTEAEALKKSKAVSFEGVRATKTARENLNRLSSAVRKRKGLDQAIKETGANSFNVSLACEVAKLSDNDQKNIEQRFEQTMAVRNRKKGLKYYQGYPHPSEDPQEKGQFKARLNEGTIVVPMPEGGDPEMPQPPGISALQPT